MISLVDYNSCGSSDSRSCLPAVVWIYFSFKDTFSPSYLASVGQKRPSCIFRHVAPLMLAVLFHYCSESLDPPFVFLLFFFITLGAQQTHVLPVDFNALTLFFSSF